MLETYLQRLNARVQAHNKEIDELVELTLLTEEEAAGLRWLKPITRETVHDAEHWKHWPPALLNIVDGPESVHAEVNPREIIRLAKSVKNPTQITRDLCKGAARSKGATDPDWPHNVHQKLIQVAHLYARAEMPPAPPADVPVPALAG